MAFLISISTLAVAGLVGTFGGLLARAGPACKIIKAATAAIDVLYIFQTLLSVYYYLVHYKTHKVASQQFLLSLPKKL